ncbi:MAG: DUF1385 domain-containing protein [Ruminococcaceae bacterium]|nr:DUF1385 domain-containing protein [Oscillospiraceae bacterium]
MAEKNCRLGTVGGQAVIEGVMMKNKDEYALAVRMPEGNIRVTKDKCKSIKERFKPFGWPIIRGIVNMIESLVLSMKTLTISADAFGLEEEETKFEIWLKKKFGKSLLDFVMVIAMILGIGLGVGLFFFLPLFVSSSLFDKAGHETKWYATLVEGGIKIAIFVGYIWLVSLMKDIRRVFEYHGAEHKTIFCYEAGEELTPENVKKYKRFHPRCGTSFIFVILLLSILVSSVVYSFDFMKSNIILKFASKILTLPLTIGIGYEFIRFAGRHDNVFTKIISAPGLWMQRLTTREPDETQIEVAIASLKCALPTDFPEAEEIYKPEIYKKPDPEEVKAAYKTEEDSAEEQFTPITENTAEDQTSPTENEQKDQ